MTLTPEQLQTLQDAARPLIEWLKTNCHPHCKAIVDNDQAEVLEGLAITPSSFTAKRQNNPTEE